MTATQGNPGVTKYSESRRKMVQSKKKTAPKKKSRKAIKKR